MRRDKSECIYQRTQQCKTQRISQWRKHFTFHLLESEDGYKACKDYDLRKENGFTHLSAHSLKKPELRQLVKLLQPHHPSPVIQCHKNALHHNYGTIYDDTKIYCTHAKQVGRHTFQPHKHEGKQQRKRHDNTHRQGGSPVRHEYEHYKCYQHNAFNEIMKHRMRRIIHEHCPVIECIDANTLGQNVLIQILYLILYSF